MKHIRILLLSVSTTLAAGGLMRAAQSSPPAPKVQAAPNPFCSDYEATREAFKNLCEFTVTQKRDMKTIFIGGYYMRSLVAGYEMFGNQAYLDAAIAFADRLLTSQSEHGYWGTGYGNIYLADTGSALGLFIKLYPHVDRERQRKYQQAVQRYVDAIEHDGLINPSGAFGVGYRGTPDGRITGIFPDEYTISSALSGGVVFTWLYTRTGTERYRDEAHAALRWVLGTMREDGAIPHVIAGLGCDLNKKGDPKNDAALWNDHPSYISTYVGEGMLAFDMHCGKPEWQKEIRAGMKKYVAYLLARQNEDGSWGVKGSLDQKRSPGTSNLLVWYYQHAEQDPRVAAAVRKFNRFLVAPASAREFGLLNVGGDASGQSAASKAGKFVTNDIITALSGRALADMLVPGIDAQW